MLHLKIITPRKVVYDLEVDSVTVPSADGEVTVLPKHTYLLSLLKEGIITTRVKGKEEYLAIGGGYLETNGKEANVLVSRAFHQNELDEEVTQKAIEEAKKILVEAEDEAQRAQALSVIRHSAIDMKLIKRRKTRPLS